ncbi:AAA family ATPase [Lichenibacterium minor]|uniref:AAA family ATPase n=1 Tax=Lichenibacterium minor TaxID=2316528 RepID=A0A4Q2U1H5_9HYPH|nr:AAA family ATPase [Lichenibacterium minor]RYC30303.1 AAA family ATPase [Lichenibacterium minor]
MYDDDKLRKPPRNLRMDYRYIDQEDLSNPGSEYTRHADFQEEVVKFSLLDFLSEHVPDPGFIAGLFPRGDVSLIVGDTAVGKSMLAMQLAVSVAANRSFLGQSTDTRPEKGNVLALFREDIKSKVHKRLTKIISDLSIPPEIAAPHLRVHWLSPEYRELCTIWRNCEPTTGWALLNEIIDQLKPVDLLIIDTLKIAFDDEMTGPLSVRRFVAALRDLAIARNIAIVCVSHTNKEGKAAGTTEWPNHVRAVFRIAKHYDHYLFECLKTNYDRSTVAQPLVRTANGAFALLPEPEMATRRAAIDKSQNSRCRELFLAAIRTCSETSGRQKEGFSRHKKARNYAPKAIAVSLRAQKIKVTQAQLETVMEALLSEGLLIEMRKPRKHATMVLAVSESTEGVQGSGHLFEAVKDLRPDSDTGSH